MIVSQKIIVDIKELEEYISQQRAEKQKIVLAQGHFNVIHPGHMRFLEFAKQQGDQLIIAVQGEKQLAKPNKDKFFSAKERARGVASIAGIDRVTIFNDTPFSKVVDVVRPDVYVKGEEYAARLEDIKEELSLIKKVGGKVVFGSGEITYSPTEFLEHDPLDITISHFQSFKNALERQNISIKDLRKYCNSFKDVKMLVLGDTIVDQYIACDALGMSSEAPVLVVRELEEKKFVGGAAVVARHIRALGAQCTFVSILGNDEAGQLVKTELANDQIETKFFQDGDRPTTFKIRYMVGPQKVLRVTRLKEHHIHPKIEDGIIKYLDENCQKINGLIVSDFVYGMITPRLLDHISKLSKKCKFKLFGDVQSSSQIGNVCKFNGYELVTPTEREARIALDDNFNGLERLGTNMMKRAHVKNLVITLADKGFISFQNGSGNDFINKQHFPALNTNPVDVVGAGDSLLSGLSISLAAGANLMEASAIASGVASIACGKVGNIPVNHAELDKWLGDVGHYYDIKQKE